MSILLKSKNIIEINVVDSILSIINKHIDNEIRKKVQKK